MIERKQERRTQPTTGDRRSNSEPVKALGWLEPLDWSEADQAAPDDSGQVSESGTE